jgi:hypothetical protein
MKTRILCLILLAGSLAFAESYTATTSGHFNTDATWGGSGHPHSGDTFMIPIGITVTCDSTDTGGCTSGLETAGTCTADGVVQGTLVVGNGGTLTHGGELDIQHGATLQITAASANATLAIKPGSGATCKLWFTTDGGTGAAHLNMSGTSASVLAILKGDLSGGGAAMVMPSPGDGVMPNVDISGYSQLDHCGSASLTCGNGSFFNVSGNTTIHTLLVTNTASLDLHFPEDSISNVDVNGISVVDPVGCSDILRFSDSTAPGTATRTFKNITAYVDTALAASCASDYRYVAFFVHGGKCGDSRAEGDDSDVSCFQGYNAVIMSNDSSSDTVDIVSRENMIVADAISPGAIVAGMASNDQAWQDSIVYTRLNNPHQFASSTNVGGTQNLYTRNICDNDGYAWGDTGNFVEDNGTHTVDFNLDINGCGQLDSDQGRQTGFIDTNNTVAMGYGVSLGNWAIQYPALTVKRNLIVKPYDPTSPPQEGLFQTGLTVQGVFVRQDVRTVALDYNGFYLMMGSGDTDPVLGSATPCGQQGYSCPLPNAHTGTSVSYVGVPAVQIGDVSCTLTSGTNDTTAVYSNCSTDLLQPGDFVVEQSVSRPFAQIDHIEKSRRIDLVPPGISGLVPGDVINVSPSYWDTPAPPGILYGTTSGVGTHDIHADPDFYDPTRTLCSYFVRVGGGTAPCSWDSALGAFGGHYQSTSTSGTTVINDTAAGVNFTTFGIEANNDWVLVYQGSCSSFRCAVQVTSVSPTQLIVDSCPGLTTGDGFTFITALRGLGRAIVTLNGWDYQGNPVTPTSWATTAQAWAWVRAGFAPQNLVYKGAGDDGSDLGAVPVLTGTGLPAVRHR